MTAELVRGQNHPLSQVRLEIRISADVPLVAGAALGDEHGMARGAEWVAHPGAPVLPGIEVPRRAGADHRLAVDLAAVPEAVHRVTVLLALPSGAGGPLRFGAVAAPSVAVTGLDGTGIVHCTLAGLDAESAVIAVELYRRRGMWKVRAVGQGYAGGLAALLADLGLREATELAGAVQESVTAGLARPVAAPLTHPSEDRPRRTAGTAAASDQPGARPAPGYDGLGAQARQISGAPDPVTGGTGQPAHPDPVSGGPAAAPGGGARPTPPGAADAVRAAAHGLPPGSTGGPVDYTHPARGHRTLPPPSPGAQAAPGDRPAPPVAGDAVGWSMDERLYNQVWGMFEDLARATAAYRGAVDFADSRLEKDLDNVLADPRNRMGSAGDAAREEARARRAHLVERATAALDRDLNQLTAEAEVVEPALPPAYARWNSPVWQEYRVPEEASMAVRLGDLHLPESASLRIPMLVRLPLERGLWIDSGPTTAADGPMPDAGVRHLAVETAVALTARLLAAHPAGELGVHVIDAAGAGAVALAPLVRAGVLETPPAVGAAGVADVLGGLTRRVDLVQMALRGDAVESLPPGLDTARQLLIVNDFPHGFDDRAVTRLRYLADEGPSVGVHLLIVADREDASSYGPLLDPLWRSLMRLTPVPDDHLADPWNGHAWTYEPPLPPAGSQVLHRVLTEVAGARTKRK